MSVKRKKLMLTEILLNEIARVNRVKQVLDIGVNDLIIRLQKLKSGPEPIIDTLCYGVKCHHHSDCHRYLALENDKSDLPRIATCIQQGTKTTWPLFMQKS